MELLEASCYGDAKSAETLLNHGMDPNFLHPMNGLSPLHWAAKRNHLPIVELLLSRGADPGLKSKDNQKASDLATDESVLAALSAPPRSEIISKEQHPLVFTPHYLKSPPLDYRVDISKIVKKPPTDESLSSIPLPSNHPERRKDLLILKIKCNSDEFFVEVPFTPSEVKSFKEFVALLAQELELTSPDSVSLIVKLPDTRLRKLEEIQRLSNYQEILVRTKD
eukprot:TRINITY_DN5475_c0_g1_i1.p1 TRINITY_DN5475_c0_g1~~TRINITY_DN5475_c0_g1_i1.p1  ORF type:complete len:223 (+),score=65.51 TRINITY_DN5475_c0_g1_i1:256-924(+)